MSYSVIMGRMAQHGSCNYNYMFVFIRNPEDSYQIVRESWVQIPLLPLLAVWPWAYYLTSLSFNFW